MSLPVLRTDRLELRIGTVNDAPLHVNYTRRNLERLRQAGPIDDRFLDERFWRDRLAAQISEAEYGRAYRFAFFAKGGDGEIVGKCTLSDLSRLPMLTARIGYSLDAAHEGRGLMHEALNGLISWAFDEHGLHRIEAAYQPWNARSGRVLERLGFRIEGFAKDYLFLDGAWRDHVLTAKTNDAWKPR